MTDVIPITSSSAFQAQAKRTAKYGNFCEARITLYRTFAAWLSTNPEEYQIKLEARLTRDGLLAIGGTGDGVS